MEVRNIYERGPRVRLVFPEDEGRTRQEGAAECDINNIMSKYLKTGVVSHFNRHSASYGDCDAMTYHEAMNVVIKADAMFADLPAKLRKELGDDPAAFLEFVGDEANLESLEAHGLLKDDNSVAVAREAAAKAAADVLALADVSDSPPASAPVAPVVPPLEAPSTVPT